MAYGDKRDFRKIDIFVHGKYVASTNWAKSMREAREKYIESNPDLTLEDVMALYSKDN